MILHNKKFIYGMYIHLKSIHVPDILITTMLTIGLSALDNLIVLLIMTFIFESQEYIFFLSKYKIILMSTILICNYIYVKYIANIKKIIIENNHLDITSEKELHLWFKKSFIGLFLLLIFLNVLFVELHRYF